MITTSVVIPTYNRADGLRSCLQALAAQSEPADAFEVIVIDDGSTDGTPDVLSEIDTPFRLVVERQVNAGAAAARNRGIRRSSGRYCIFIDDDILADRNLVAGHREAQDQRGGIVGVGGLRISSSRKRGGLVSYFCDWWAEHYRCFEDGERIPDFWSGFSGNLSAPRATLTAVEGFDESLDRSEDVELTYRLERAGLEIAFVAEAGGEQVYAKGFREIVNDFDRAGAAAVSLWRRHPELLDHAPLGDFAQGGVKVNLARRTMLALRVPVWPLALVDPLLSRRPPGRVYRFLQLYCFWRSLREALGDRETWRRLTRGPVILMYHAVGGPGEGASRYVIPPRRLRLQLTWMRWRRRPVLSLDEYILLRSGHRLPPARAVILTFDDAYRDTAERAAPILRSRDMEATIYVVSGAVGASNDWDDGGPLGGRPLMSWDEIDRLRTEGFAIGSHTVDHIDLTTLDEADADRQLIRSREEIGRRFEVDVVHFSYPYGRSNDTVRSLAVKAGYASAVGITQGPNGQAVPAHDLRRLEIWGTRPLIRFALDLWLGLHLGSPERRGR